MVHWKVIAMDSSCEEGFSEQGDDVIDEEKSPVDDLAVFEEAPRMKDHSSAQEEEKERAREVDGEEEEEELRSAREVDDKKREGCVLVTRYEGSKSKRGPCEFLERWVTEGEYAELLERSALAKLPRLLGVKIRVARLFEELKPGELAENKPVLRLMADAKSGIVGWPWTSVFDREEAGGLGSVDVFREDEEDFGVIDAANLHDYLDRLLEYWDDGIGEHRPREQLSPVAFQDFLRQRSRRVKEKSIGMTSPETRHILFDDTKKSHLQWPRVALHSLKAKPHLNGKTGYRGFYFDTSQRYAVFLDEDSDNKPITVKPDNITLLTEDTPKNIAELSQDHEVL